MGFIKRVATPRPAKKVIRAVERPAKTARQVMTPTPVKRAASRSWRAANPSVGIRQEIEGRGVEATRRRLHGRRGQPTSQEISWTPENVPFRAVPILANCRAFAILESERLTAEEQLQRLRRDDQVLAPLAMVIGLYNAQADTLVELVKRNDQAAPSDLLPLTTWADAWLDAARSACIARIAQRDQLKDRMDDDAVERIRDRVVPAIDAIVARAEVS